VGRSPVPDRRSVTKSRDWTLSSTIAAIDRHSSPAARSFPAKFVQRAARGELSPSSGLVTSVINSLLLQCRDDFDHGDLAALDGLDGLGKRFSKRVRIAHGTERGRTEPTRNRQQVDFRAAGGLADMGGLR